LSPPLFILEMNVIIKEILKGLSWAILYADELVLIVMTLEELKTLRWTATLRRKVVNIGTSRPKVVWQHADSFIHYVSNVSIQN
jgi:hypothetical protein